MEIKNDSNKRYNVLVADGNPAVSDYISKTLAQHIPSINVKTATSVVKAADEFQKLSVQATSVHRLLQGLIKKSKSFL